MKAKCPEFENHERWLISYADMLTLLFALFVVLYAQNMDKPKDPPPAQKVLAESVQDSFNVPLPDIPIDRRVGPVEQGLGIFEHMKGDQLRPPMTQKFPSQAERVKIIASDMRKLQMNLEERLYGPQKFSQKGDTGQERIVKVQRTSTGFKLQLLARHFFKSGETTLNQAALPELEQVSQVLKELGRPITVEGHTDNVPPSGSMSNWEISTLRAASVAKYFVRQSGFPPSKISIAGYADLRPIASNSTESGRAANRRIEIQINYDQESAPPRQE